MNWRQHTVTHLGLDLAVQEHGPDSGPLILALHGWLDNSASFNALAEALPEFHFLLPDFPGHGLSAHRHEQADYAIWSYLADVLAVADKLAPEKFIILGHSMGGAVACFLSALYPERMQKLILLDAIGPLVTPAAEVPQQMLQAMQARLTRKLNYRHRYPDFAAAVAARASKGLSTQAATALAQRGVVSDAKGYYWQLDPRLNMKNMLSLTEEQAAAFITQIRCPALLIAAQQYWQGRETWFEQRLGYFRELEVHMLQGSHHQHMEEQAGQVAELVRTFILQGTCKQ